MLETFLTITILTNEIFSLFSTTGISFPSPSSSISLSSFRGTLQFKALSTETRHFAIADTSPVPTRAPTVINLFDEGVPGNSSTSWSLESFIILAVCLSTFILIVAYVIYRKCTTPVAYVLYGNPEEFPSAECSSPRSQKTTTETEVTFAEDVKLEMIDIEEIRNGRAAISNVNMNGIVFIDLSNVQVIENL